MSDDEERRLIERRQNRELWEEVGLRIRRARIKKGLSVEEVAERLGHAPETVYRLESGSMGTRLRGVIEYARLLDIDLEELLLGEESRMDPALRRAFYGRRLSPDQVGRIVRYADRIAQEESEEPSRT